jgi:hypothetical protein
MAEPSGRTSRSRPRLIVGAACLAAGIILFLFGYSEIDFSASRYFAFVAGGALIVAAFLVLSMRAATLVTAVFVAAVAVEGPIPADGANALRVLGTARVPGYAASVKGFVGPTRDFPYRVFVGSPEGIGPFMVRPPERFRLDQPDYAPPAGVYSSAVSAGPSNILHHDGYSRLVSWHGPRPGGGSCLLELEVADAHRVAESLAVASGRLRSSLEGKAVIRLIASCSSHLPPPAGPTASPGTSPSPGSTPTPGSTPSAGPTLAQRNGPR